MPNGAHIEAVDLVRHGAYQGELARLLRSLTTETIEGGETRLKEAMTEREAISAAVMFRRKHNLLVDDRVDPLIYLIGLHQARIRHRDMTPAEINWSEHWLIRNGHRCGVDTLFNPKPDGGK